MGAGMTRHELRERTFAWLFREPFLTQEEYDEQLGRFPEDEEGVISEEDAAYIRDRVRTIRGVVKELDELIDANTTGWDTTRMGKPELAILRLGVYEMCMDDDIPVGVAMDEAVELAKKYGQENAGAFVNAILSKVKDARGLG